MSRIRNGHSKFKKELRNVELCHTLRLLALFTCVWLKQKGRYIRLNGSVGVWRMRNNFIIKYCLGVLKQKVSSIFRLSYF